METLIFDQSVFLWKDITNFVSANSFTNHVYHYESSSLRKIWQTRGAGVTGNTKPTPKADEVLIRVHATSVTTFNLSTMYKSALLLSFVLFFLNASAQNKDCKVKELDNGKITVKYCISKSYDQFGKKVVHIQDSTTTIDSINFEKCISLMKDIKKHKLFTGDYKSELVKTISVNEWIIYYYTKNPWPIANSDCVLRMVFTENIAANIATFTLEATPSEFEKGDVNRMTNFNIVYTFKDLGNDKVKITMTGKSSPPVKAPMWLIKSAFPGAPGNAIRKFIKLTKA